MAFSIENSEPRPLIDCSEVLCGAFGQCEEPSEVPLGDDGRGASLFKPFCCELANRLEENETRFRRGLEPVHQAMTDETVEVVEPVPIVRLSSDCCGDGVKCGAAPKSGQILEELLLAAYMIPTPLASPKTSPFR